MIENPANAIIIDDQLIAIKNLEFLLKNHPEIKIVKSFTNSFEGFKALKILSPDIVFLDLHMPKISGIEIIRMIELLKLHVHVIIVTGHESLVIKAGHYGVIDYLLKPVLPKNLEHSIEKYKIHKANHKTVQNIEKNTNNIVKKIRIPTSFEDFFFNATDIFYLEADGNYTNIVMPWGEKITSSYHLGKIQKFLPQDTFYRVSRKIIINFNYLQKIDKRKKICVLSYNNSELEIVYSKGVINQTGLLVK